MSPRWQSIGRRLPLLTTALLIAAVSATAAISYREMRSSLLHTAGDRVTAVSKQVADLLGTSYETLARTGSPLSHDSVLRRALVDPSPAMLARARAHLDSLQKADTTSIALALMNRTLAPIAASGKVLNDSITRPAYFAGNASLVGDMLAFHDTVATDLRLPIVSGNDTVGFVRRLSRVSSKTQKQLLSALIGGNGLILIGNRTGDVWTDLNGRAAAPTNEMTTGRAVEATDSNNARMIGALSPVARTPWVVWVGFSHAVVLAPARTFLWRILAIDILIVLLATLVAWQISHRVVGPITEITQAAEKLAGGDFSARSKVKRRDEIGRLATAFNTMASAIQISTTELEDQAVELELQSTELEETNEELRHNIEEATKERLSAEQARARAAAIIDAAYTCIVIVDADGQIIDFNPAAESAFALTQSEARERTISDLIPSLAFGPGKDHKRLVADMTLPDGKPRVIESSGRRVNGVSFPADLAVTHIPMDGRTMYGVFLRDLTERAQLQSQLAQARKMEAIGRLAGGVAHDFNNILTVVISYSDLVLGDDTIAEGTRADVELIRQAADRAAGLTRQLLAFSRKQVLRPEVLNANDAIGDVFKMLKRVIPANIKLEVKSSGSLPHIFADRGQIEQVLMNLAVNARDAMPHGGNLIIETDETTLDDAYIALHPGGTPGRHVVISVRDTGLGMDAETKARIFEPFFTTKAPGQGTGLGLATVYGIVQQSGGSVYVYSEPDHGTTFKLYFPVHDGEAPVVAPEFDPVSHSGPPLHILLVEDDASVRNAVFATIERLGHEVRSAPNVSAALEVLRGDGVWANVVVTDAVMPGQSGLELADILRTERPDLPVIVVSGYSEEAVTGGRMSSGAVFLEKPFTAADLARALITARNDRGTAHGAVLA